MTKLIGQEIK